MPKTIRQIIPADSVIPVLTINKLEHAVPLAQTLTRAGINILEVTLRTACARDAAAAIIAAMPDLIVGIGTVTSVAELKACKQLGVQFAVSPGLSETLCSAAATFDIPYLPGVQTTSEVMRGRELDFELLKFFPAKSSGGIEKLQQFGALFPDTRFCPTGGITETDFETYLQQPNVHCVGASWIAPTALIDAAVWSAIEQRARNAVGSG